jgi:hypothetical protein
MNELPDTPDDDPVFELRLYRVEPGRRRDMEARVRDDLRILFPRHGIRPLGGWSMVAGPDAPLYVYLTPFHDMGRRMESWAAFGADPDWAECRARTNAGSELVQRYDILFLRAQRGWRPDPQPAARPLVEMRMQPVAVGKAAPVRSALQESVLPLLEAAGAHLNGCFDVTSGANLPAIVLFIRWEGLDQRAAALDRLDALLRQDAAMGQLFGRADQYLMEEAQVDWDPVDAPPQRG